MESGEMVSLTAKEGCSMLIEEHISKGNSRMETQSAFRAYLCTLMVLFIEALSRLQRLMASDF